jgi:hypothetical protein
MIAVALAVELFFAFSAEAALEQRRYPISALA